LEEVFPTIRELVIRGQGEFFEVLINHRIDLPSVKRLDLIMMDDIPFDHLRRFFNKTRQTLSVVHVESSCLFHRWFYCGGHRWRDQRPEALVLGFLHTLGKSMALKEVSLKIKNYPTVYTDFFAQLLLARASPSDFELFLQHHQKQNDDAS
jgi:hypothetical protein